MSVFLGISADDWVPIVTAVSALVLLVSGIVAVTTSRSNARKTLTFQTLHGTLWDKDYQQFRREWDKIQRVFVNFHNLKALEQYYLETNDSYITERMNSYNRRRKHKKSHKKQVSDITSKEVRRKIYNDDLAIIRAVLNDFELISIGIRAGILDEEMCLRYMRGMVLSDWQMSSQIIKSIRRKYNNTLLLAEFDSLAQRWEMRFVRHAPLARFRSWPPPRD